MTHLWINGMYVFISIERYILKLLINLIPFQALISLCISHINELSLPILSICWYHQMVLVGPQMFDHKRQNPSNYHLPPLAYSKRGGEEAAAPRPPPPAKAKLKITDFVDKLISKGLSDIRFSLHRPLKLADDW